MWCANSWQWHSDKPDELYSICEDNGNDYAGCGKKIRTKISVLIPLDVGLEMKEREGNREETWKEKDCSICNHQVHVLLHRSSLCRQILMYIKTITRNSKDWFGP